VLFPLEGFSQDYNTLLSGKAAKKAALARILSVVTPYETRKYNRWDRL